MTTAHRPTWHTAKGGSEQGGNVLINPSRAYSSKDMPAHTTLKERSTGQGNLHEQQKIDFRAELLEREAELAGKKRLASSAAPLLTLQDQEGEEIYDEGSDTENAMPAQAETTEGAYKRFKAAEPEEEKTESVLASLPYIESPFAQDADFD